MNKEINKQYAEDFKEANNWSTLSIKDKYVIDDKFPGKDISLDMEFRSFAESLYNLFQSLQIKRNCFKEFENPFYKIEKVKYY